MSGSGNSDFSSNPIFNGANGTSCNLLQVRTQLISPQPQAIENLSVGDCLTLQINRQEGVIIEAYKQEEKAGGIVSPELLACMENGHQYVAIVKKIIEGQVQISIKHI
ncbi:hypothetical protein [Aggregatibacter actinomycetemcomitans]|uniref:hypothetical protein n=1 Tax=Aggregatibacter actinomycetemcomitans TaxID=714 RepID=UPI001E2EA654|nr:hypothetical protein [Aggregatibacter actinomycetemcomitans]